MALYEYKCEACGLINTRDCPIAEYTDEWDGACGNCNSHDLRRIYIGVTVKWSSLGIGPTHRYRDRKLEDGLEYEKKRYGRVLTDSEATEVNEVEGL